MADVRSLLRNERASRRIIHPHATYSSTGTLLCSVCHIQLKSDSLWDSHLRSPQHATRLQKTRDKTLTQAPEAASNETNNTYGTKNSKKRKAGDDAEDEDDRKRTRPMNTPGNLPQGFFDTEHKSTDEDDLAAAVENLPLAAFPVIDPRKPNIHTPIPDEPSTTDLPIINEDEWAAFERDVATPPPSPPRPSALTAEATIVAAPLTAAEIAARAREDASTQAKEQREAELEGEKEDAARQLDEEFDEMEVLEERVRRLREKREELRRRREKGVEGSGGGGMDGVVGGREGIGALDTGKRVDEEDEIDEEDEDEDEDWRLWGPR